MNSNTKSDWINVNDVNKDNEPDINPKLIYKKENKNKYDQNSQIKEYDVYSIENDFILYNQETI